MLDYDFTWDYRALPLFWTVVTETLGMNPSLTVGQNNDFRDLVRSLELLELEEYVVDCVKLFLNRIISVDGVPKGLFVSLCCNQPIDSWCKEGVSDNR